MEEQKKVSERVTNANIELVVADKCRNVGACGLRSLKSKEEEEAGCEIGEDVCVSADLTAQGGDVKIDRGVCDLGYGEYNY